MRCEKRYLFPFLKGVVFFSCAAAVLACMAVDYFVIAEGGQVLLASPVRGGSRFSTSYIHSVQRTPVIDEYRVMNGRIWGWEERVQSHNAGLPFEAPERGRFLMAPPWMIVQGGRKAMEQIAYRVGDEEFGKNAWTLPPFGEVKAFEKYGRRRVTFGVLTKRLDDAPVVGFASLKSLKVSKGFRPEENNPRR